METHTEENQKNISHLLTAGRREEGSNKEKKGSFMFPFNISVTLQIMY